ncbi:MAG TPA: hypothetical protein PKA00_23300 [Saprospiraceae bacterium]|nr:hypothetical protein [Saprospiraceae bacterium]HMQ85856.1 hypothetical protein [Saprospiraceae bacterium]
MLKPLAQVVSIIFHPLLIVSYMLVLLLLVNPYLFGVSNILEEAGQLLLLQTFLSTFFIPAIAVLMLRFLGMVDSLELKSRQERIGPYIITAVLYLWMYKNFIESSYVPTAFSGFMLGAVIGLLVAFFINIFSKISAHAVGMGGLLAMVIITMLLFSYDTFLLGSYEISMSSILMLTVLLAGMVGSARLLLQAHEPMDLYGGFLVGFVAQFIALKIVF